MLLSPAKGGVSREPSPVATASTLITSAPRQRRVQVQNGPDRCWVRSTTRNCFKDAVLIIDPLGICTETLSLDIKVQQLSVPWRVPWQAGNGDDDKLRRRAEIHRHRDAWQDICRNPEQAPCQCHRCRDEPRAGTD